MSKIKRFFVEKKKDPVARERLFTLLFAVMVFLLPVWGWNPLLLLWLVKIACIYKETNSRGVHVFYCFMALTCIAMITLNVYASILNL